MYRVVLNKVYNKVQGYLVVHNKVTEQLYLRVTGEVSRRDIRVTGLFSVDKSVGDVHKRSLIRNTPLRGPCSWTIPGVILWFSGGGGSFL